MRLPDRSKPGVRNWASRFEPNAARTSATACATRCNHRSPTGIPALLIGTDVPGLDVAYLARAAAALQSNDAVVGPAEDGGYVLVGLARDVDAFGGVHWSTPEVMAQTRAKLAAAGVRWTELPTLWDLDTQEDFVRWQALDGKTARVVATLS